MRRITVSLPDDLAEDLTKLSEILGVSRSAFLSAYLSKKISDLASVAVEYEHLNEGHKQTIRNRGDSSREVMRIAEQIVRQTTKDDDL